MNDLCTTTFTSAMSIILCCRTFQKRGVQAGISNDHRKCQATRRQNNNVKSGTVDKHDIVSLPNMLSYFKNTF